MSHLVPHCGARNIVRILNDFPVDFPLILQLLQNTARDGAARVAIDFVSPARKNAKDIQSTRVSCMQIISDTKFSIECPALLRLDGMARICVTTDSLDNRDIIPYVQYGTRIQQFAVENGQLQWLPPTASNQAQAGMLLSLPCHGTLPSLPSLGSCILQYFLLAKITNLRMRIQYCDMQSTELLQLKSAFMTSASPERHIRGPKNKAKKPVTKTMLCKLPWGLNRTQAASRLSSIRKGVLEISITAHNLISTEQKVGPLLHQHASIASQRASHQHAMHMSNWHNASISFGGFEPGILMGDSQTRVQGAEPSYFTEKFSVMEYNATITKPPHIVNRMPQSETMSAILFHGSVPTQVVNMLKPYVFSEYCNAKVCVVFDNSNNVWDVEQLSMAGMLARCVFESLNSACTIGSQMDGVVIQTSSPTTTGVVRNKFWQCVVNNPKVATVLFQDVNAFLRGTYIRSTKLRSLHYVSLSTIASDVGHSPLNLDRAREYVAWLAAQWDDLTVEEQTILFSALKVKFTVRDKFRVYEMTKMTSYDTFNRYKQSYSSTTGIVPADCVPAELAVELGNEHLTKFCLHKLQTKEWLKYMACQYPLKEGGDTTCAQYWLMKYRQAWVLLSGKSRKQVISLFNTHPCIPTQLGAKLPNQAFLVPPAYRKLFHGLPLVEPMDSCITDDWLQIIGVDTCISLELLRKSLAGCVPATDWDNLLFVQYLCDNQHLLTTSDWTNLYEGRFFKAFDRPHDLYCINELFAPSFRKHGFLSIEFPDANSRELEFLFHLGLHNHPPEVSLHNVVEYELEIKNMRQRCHNADIWGHSTEFSYSNSSGSLYL